MIVAIQFSKIIFIFDEHFLVKFDWRFAYSLCVCVCVKMQKFLQNRQVSYQSATLLKQVIITMLTIYRFCMLSPLLFNEACVNE